MTLTGSKRHDRPELGPPHGFGNDARSRFLRRPPPARALQWVEAVLGAPVTGVRACKGGSSSAIHKVRLARRVMTTTIDTVILRRYVLAELIAEEPDIVWREARALRLLERCQLATPRLLGVDPTGDEAGVPSVLMTRLPRRPDWSPSDMDRYLRDLAEALPALHSTAVRDDDGVPSFRPYRPRAWAPPGWLTRRELWDRAVEIFHQPPLDPDRVFIHRDYHPGNALWRQGRLSGVVDWQAASLGPRSADISHCRFNLIDRFGLGIADCFVGLWEAISGAAYHPWSEIVMLVDAMSWPRSRCARACDDLESALGRRLSELGR